MKKLISVVVPVYNEEKGLGKFLDGELMPILMTLDKSVAEEFGKSAKHKNDSLADSFVAEVILVDDGSEDKSIEVAKNAEINHNVPVKIVALSRNFGKEVVLSAGIKEAHGDAVIMIDADGQHPVEVIPEMIAKWEEGAEVVTAVRGENTTKHRLASKCYYGMMRMMGNRNMVVGALDFRLIDRVVANEFNKFTEHNRLTRGLIDWLGFRQAYIPVKTKGRIDGKPTYSFRKLMTLAGDSMVSMSRTPLVIFGYVGIFITVCSVIFGLFILIEQYMMGDPMKLDWSGAVAMSVFVSFLVGLVLISQSITALYISQIHAEAKGRPLYVVDKKRSVGIE